MKIPSPYALYNIRYHWGLVKLLYIYIYITHSYYMRCRSVLSKIKRGPIALPCLANFYYIHINNYIYTDPINISSIHIAIPCHSCHSFSWPGSVPTGAARRWRRAGVSPERRPSGRPGHVFFPWENDAMLGIMCVCICIHIYIYVYIYIHPYIP